MMEVINIRAAKTHLSRIVDRAAAGEEIIMAKAGKPFVKIISYSVARKPRAGGQLKGLIHETDDAWVPNTALEAEMTQTLLHPMIKDRSGWLVAEETETQNSK